MDKWELAEEKLEILDELLDKYGDVKTLFNLPLRRVKETDEYDALRWGVEHRAGDADKINEGLDRYLRDVFKFVEANMKEIVVTDEAVTRGKHCVIRPVCFDKPVRECTTFYYPVFDHELGDAESIDVRAPSEEDLFDELAERSYTSKCLFVDPSFEKLYDLESGDEVDIDKESKMLVEYYRKRLKKLGVELW